MIFAAIFLLLLCNSFSGASQNEFCSLEKDDGCSINESSLMQIRYIFYDVNPPEGFNLRRDVYMRMAVFARNLKKHFNCFLVLPPWPHLYHWQSDDIAKQSRLPWSLFFDVKSLQSFAPVIEMNEFFETGIKELEQVFVLQHFADTFTSGNFEDRMQVESCLEKIPYKRVTNSYSGYFWGYKNVSSKKVDCLSFHGPVSQLIDVVKNTKAGTIMFDHAEVALHDRFGDKTYWDARKSMRFARHLIEESNKYMKSKLNYTAEEGYLKSEGGNYLCVHMRRKDFLHGHSKNVPSISGAARQIEAALKAAALNVVFVATDATEEEKRELKARLSDRLVLTYTPTAAVKTKWKDGGVAIIEQIICSNARQFIGTHESTFSFRIQEEREIKGFRSETTFQRLCGDSETKCRQPSRWRIVH